jgi:hypothetical protein
MNVEQILAGPHRVQCAPYRANLSREACLKQQEVARRQQQKWWGYCGNLESRDPCLKCRTGKELRKEQPDLPWAGTGKVARARRPRLR